MAVEDDLAKLLRGDGPPSGRTFKDLGLSALAKRLPRVPNTLYGKWCSRCRGIWFGLVGECECPKCGNRHG